MSSFPRLCLYLAVGFCVVQVSFSKINKQLLEDVEFSLRKLASKVGHELELEKIGFQHKLKLQLEINKRKASSRESLDCVKKNWLLAEESVITISNEGKDCMNRVNGEIDSELIKKETLDEIDDFKANFKERLQNCKKDAIDKISPIVKDIYFQIKNCTAKDVQ